MSKSKSKFGSGRYNCGSKAWHQRVVKGDGSVVKAGTILVINRRTLQAGDNVYQRKQVIHAKVNGKVSIKDKKVSVYET